VILKRPDHVKKLSLFFLPDTFLQLLHNHTFDHITAAKQSQQTKRIKTLNPTSGTIATTPLVQAQQQQTQSAFFSHAKTSLQPSHKQNPKTTTNRVS
jgi:hypothetical protein